MPREMAELLGGEGWWTTSVPSEMAELLGGGGEGGGQQACLVKWQNCWGGGGGGGWTTSVPSEMAELLGRG